MTSPEAPSEGERVLGGLWGSLVVNKRAEEDRLSCQVFGVSSKKRVGTDQGGEGESGKLPDGTRGEGRTLNLRLRRPTLYPIELLAQVTLH